MATPHSMWDLSSTTGMEPTAPAVGVQSLNHWTTKEVLAFVFQLMYKEESGSRLEHFPVIFQNAQYYAVYRKGCQL